MFLHPSLTNSIDPIVSDIKSCNGVTLRMGINEHRTACHDILGLGWGLDRQIDRQTDGIAIESRLGRNLACAHMQKWNEKLLAYQHKRLI